MLKRCAIYATYEQIIGWLGIGAERAEARRAPPDSRAIRDELIITFSMRAERFSDAFGQGDRISVLFLKRARQALLALCIICANIRYSDGFLCRFRHMTCTR